MTRKKQVIEILEKYSVKRVYFNSDDSICAERINVRDEVVDTILALDLDVPSEEEINNCWRYGYVCLPTACQLSQTIKGTLTIPLVSGM